MLLLTTDRAHISAIVSASDLGSCTALALTAMAKDLEIWNIATTSVIKSDYEQTRPYIGQTTEQL